MSERVLGGQFSRRAGRPNKREHKTDTETLAEESGLGHAPKKEHRTEMPKPHHTRRKS